MTDDQEAGPAGVTGPKQPKQAGDIRDRWWWIEHGVWTERMLTRLEQSEPTTVWFGLWDKVISERNLQAGFWAVWRNAGAAGVDGQTVPQFEAQQKVELAQLREELRQDGPTDGLRRKDCLVWNMVLAPMVSLAETPLTGKPDAGNPPVRFGGRGGAKAPSLPLSAAAAGPNGKFELTSKSATLSLNP